MRRYALYFVPPADSELLRFANAWLGRDPDRDAALAHPALADLEAAEIEAVTRAPRHYGFHATLKAPFALAEGQMPDQLHALARDFAGGRERFALRLRLGCLDGFLALVPAEASPALDEFAAACVRRFDQFRAPLTDEERARRRPEQLEPAERALLDRWGYPYVLDRFRFHMTLTERLREPQLARVRAVLERELAPHLDRPVPVDTLAVFEQPERGAPFIVTGRYPLAAARDERRPDSAAIL